MNENTEDQTVEVMYYGGGGFYSSLYINTAYANGLTDEDLTEMTNEDYNEWFNPPEGKYGTWVDGTPVVLDLPPPDYVAIATKQRDTLLSESNAATYPLSLKMQMGRTLTDGEKAKVNAWMDYSDALNALDLSTAPDITWPDKPQ